MLSRTPLSSPWHLRALGTPALENIPETAVAATVPGDVHMALRRAGLIPDPADDDNEHRLGWIGESAWGFSTTVPALAEEAAEAERIELVFHGIDTAATIRLAGSERARVQNMHRTWRVPAPELAHDAVHLQVAIDSPLAVARAEQERLGARWAAFSPLPPFLRKNACAFGWDWGPALPGAGIWRPVTVEAWSTARLAALRPTARLVGDEGVVDVDVDIERTESAADTALEVLVELDGRTRRCAIEPGSDRIRTRIELPSPERWWPAGLGAQTRYELRVTLRTADGAELDADTREIGFRELIVVQEDDDEGRSFGITVNGVPMFVRGFNWIPESTSLAEVTADDVRRRIAEARDLGANLLRVWGGGVFESDDFYRICDEMGMLVWQDFLFACGAYPEEDPFPAEIEAEARENVSRLMSHPSLALWNGNNENLWFWFLHDWDDALSGASWGEGYYFGILPEVVSDLDPARTYIPGSPSSGGRWEEPNDPTKGVVHWWLPGDYRGYDEVRPRFVSEFGFQGPPARTTFDEVVSDPEPAPFSAGTVQRQKAEGGTERINDVLAAHFGVPVDFDEWYWLAQLNQARAVRYGIERFRSLEPYCRGTIVWQLNDCWPALSWSMIDSADRYKPVAHAVREAYRDRIVVLRLEDGLPTLFACNSTAEEWPVEIAVHRAHGAEAGIPVSVSARVTAHSAARIPLGSLGEGLRQDELLVATAEGSRSVLLGGTDREFPDATPRFDLRVTDAEDGILLEVVAHSLIRDAAFPVDELDPRAHADRNLLTLLPGERETWHVRTERPEAFTEEALRRILRTAHAATTSDEGYRGLARLEAERAELPTRA